MRRRAATTLAVVLMTAVGGCADGGGSTRATGAGRSVATGAALTVEPLAPPAGSASVTVDGFTLAVPPAWHTDRQEHGEITVVRLFEDDDPNPVAFLTVGPQPDANATAVRGALDSVSRSWTGTARDVVRSPVSWTGAPDAAAMRFRFDDPAGARGECDGLFVATHDPEGTTIAVVGAVAPAGELPGSAAYDVLRTLRFG